jgi:hypothetical protein
MGHDVLFKNTISFCALYPTRSSRALIMQNVKNGAVDVYMGRSLSAYTSSVVENKLLIRKL